MHILALDALAIGQGLERYVGIVFTELLESHLVVVGLWVTKLGAALGNKGKTGFVQEDGLCILDSIGCRETIELEHLGKICLVSLTDGHSGGIVVEVIILGAKGETALREIVNVLSDILLVGTETSTIAYSESHPGILDLQLLQVGLGLGSSYLVEQRLYGSYALLVAAVDIDRQLVKVGQFLLDTSLLVALFLELAQDAVDTLVVVFLQLVEASIAAVGCWQRIVLLPSACGKLIEIVGRLCRLVKIAHDKSRLVLCVCTHRHGCYHHHRDNHLHVHNVIIIWLLLFCLDFIVLTLLPAPRRGRASCRSPHRVSASARCTL